MKIDKTEYYWFTIEPYVYIGLTDKKVLLYNTLDKAIIKSDSNDIIHLVQKLLKKDNYGVVLLSNQDLQNVVLNEFIKELREKFMGDIIDIHLSQKKPIQLQPLFNFNDLNYSNTYRKHNFSPQLPILNHLHEINLFIDSTTEITKLIAFLRSLPELVVINIIKKEKSIKYYNELLSFLDKNSFNTNLLCTYIDITNPSFIINKHFLYKLSIDFPVDKKHWKDSILVLEKQSIPHEYIFNIKSSEDYEQAEQLILSHQIDNFNLKPIYTGENLSFFKENIYLTEETILNESISIKEIFMHQMINIYDFGKFNISPSGDIYANINHPMLGNIYMQNIHEIVEKELIHGISWLRIRNQTPCNNCVYQWLCPSPSQYELEIGYPNLCNVNL